MHDYLSSPRQQLLESFSTAIESNINPSQEPPINQKKPKFDETISHLIDH
jgi:hypothetical protein